MKHFPSHQEELERLKKIEGQIRGAQKMIQDGRYCVDILNVLSSVRGALEKVEDHIFERYLKCCVQNSLKSGSSKDQEEKYTEIMNLVSQFRK